MVWPADGRRVAARRFRMLQFLVYEPRRLLTGMAFDSVQVIHQEQGMSPETQVIDVDVNGDGDLDLVALQGGEVRVFDNEQGSFRLREFPTLPQTTSDPEWTLGARLTAAADLDSDGDQDLLLAGANDHVLWLENVDSRGAFGQIHFVTDANAPVSAHDLDGDGDLDLVESNTYFDSDNWYLGWYENTDGRGHFLKSHRIAAGVSGQAHVLDVDGDNHQDLVLQGSSVVLLFRKQGPDATNWAVTELLRGDPNDPFLKSQVVPYDGNAWVDVAILSENGTTILHDVGLATASHPPRLSQSGAWSDYLADLNGDQRMDQIFLGGFVLTWRPQLADGSFPEPRDIHALRSWGDDLIARDWDGDADVDLLLQRKGRIEWFENRDGKGDFDTQPATIAESAVEREGEQFNADDPISRAVHTISRHRALQAARLLDWTGDGLDDLLIESYSSEQGRRSVLQMYPNRGGYFGESQVLLSDLMLAQGDAIPWNAADMDGDSRPDLAMNLGERVKVYRHSLDGQVLAEVPAAPGFRISGVDLVDVDHDGDRDLVYSQDSLDAPRARSIWWWETGNARGPFQLPTMLTGDLTEYTRSSWHDMTGDGHLELVTFQPSHSTTSVRTWRYDAAARSMVLLDEQIVTPMQHVYVADMDSDGVGDLIHSLSDDVVISWNRGLGKPFPQERMKLNAWEEVEDIGDIDGDGDPDLVVSGERFGWIENRRDEHVWEFHEAIWPAENYLSLRLLTSDLDGDQDDDLITLSETYNRVMVYSNRHVQFDWSLNQQLDRADLDAICLAFASGSHDLQYDTDKNGLFDFEDVASFQRRTLGIQVGDLDGDGQFSSSDLVLLMQRGRFEMDPPTVALWSEGDFDCSGRFDAGDFVLAIASSGYADWREQRSGAPARLDQFELWNGDDELAGFLGRPRALHADIDTDGDNDLLIQAELYQTWYRNDGPNRPLVSQTTMDTLAAIPSTVADIDSDGDLDWYIAEQLPSWYENVDGRGHFDLRHELAIPNLSWTVAPRFEDWDHDGDLDMIGLRTEDFEAPFRSLVLFENSDGRGAFREAMVLVSPLSSGERWHERPWDLADLDGDGWTDIVVPNDAWYRNVGGSLVERERVPVPLPTGTDFEGVQFHSVLSVDLDHDGDNDLIRQSFNRLYFSYNDGSGRFTHYASDIGADRFSVTDADDDGRWELVLSYSWSEQDTQWNELDRAGFGKSQLIPGDITFPPVLLDVNGDQRLELLAAVNNPWEPLVAFVHETPDRNSWKTTVPVFAPWDLREVNSFDVDGDGRLDLLARFARAERQWFRNLGEGKWSGPTVVPANTPWGSSLKSFDIDGDGDMDVANSQGWLENSPNDTDAEWHWFPKEPVSWQDMDQDGDIDLVSVDRWIANDDGTFSREAETLLPLFPGEKVIGAADFNQDGQTDLLTEDGYDVFVHYRRGDELIERRALHGSMNRSSVIWDVDQDGDLDVVTNASLWSENVDGQFLPARSFVESKRRGEIVDQVLADFDGDGFPELVTARKESNDVTLVKLHGA